MAFTEHTISAEQYSFSNFDNLRWLEQRIELNTLNLVGKSIP